MKIQNLSESVDAGLARLMPALTELIEISMRLRLMSVI